MHEDIFRFDNKILGRSVTYCSKGGGFRGYMIPPLRVTFGTWATGWPFLQ